MDTPAADESCTVPPGFRFHPTDEELVGYYLRKKVASQKIDLDVIRDIDLYRIEPWDLQEKCWIGYEEQNEWYFFSHKDKKYPTGTRTNRATMAGFWKATGRDKAVYDKSRLIGMRKTLVFYKGRAPNGLKSDWIMHEYRLESQENAPPQEEGWVVCRAFKKRITCQATKGNEGWESCNYLYDNEPNFTRRQGAAAVAPPSTSFIMSPATPSSFLCKQELEAAEANAFMHHYSDNQLFHQQLPQLESPSLPLLKTPAATSAVEKVTDWRALHKFVASQLSHDDQGAAAAESFEDHNRCDDDMAGLLLLQSQREEGSKFNDLFSSDAGRRSSERDNNIGIFLFDN